MVHNERERRWMRNKKKVKISRQRKKHYKVKSVGRVE
jgi:hypothetical protein